MKDLQKAIKITEKTILYAKILLPLGLTEKQISKKIKKHAFDLGAERLAFPSILASGGNSKKVHIKPSNKKIKQNEFIIIDFGIVYKNCRTDITRTFCIKPDKTKKKLYNIVKNAQKRAIKKTKPGVHAKEVDLIARKYIKKHTQAKFPYSLGHGVGQGYRKRVHSYPKISPKSKHILKPGMIFTLEPGIHGNFGGIRIEDMFLLTKKGIKQLTKFPKKLSV